MWYPVLNPPSIDIQDGPEFPLIYGFVNPILHCKDGSELIICTWGLATVDGVFPIVVFEPVRAVNSGPTVLPVLNLVKSKDSVAGVGDPAPPTV